MVRDESRRYVFFRNSQFVIAKLVFQAMHICHADAADDAADNSNKSLVGAANEEVFEVRAAIELFFGRAVDRASFVPGEADYGGGRKHVGINHAMSIVGHKTDSGLGDSIVPTKFF